MYLLKIHTHTHTDPVCVCEERLVLVGLNLCDTLANKNDKYLRRSKNSILKCKQIQQQQ